MTAALVAKVSGVLTSPLVAKVGGVLTSPLVAGYAIYRYKRFTMRHNIDKVLKTGTMPKQLDSATNVVSRKEVARIREQFIEVKENAKGFGVIVGPSGTGKTYATRQACLEKPTSGVLYMEVNDSSSLAENLARTAGMRVSPGFIDRLFDKYFGTKFSTYYKLPQDLPGGIRFVLATLAERAEKFKEKNNRVPVLFIDGVDLFAKKSSVDFIDLVDCAKLHGNSGRLRIILMSSEGHVIPLINRTSSKTRCAANMYEVLDLDRTAAMKYLIDHSLSECMAEDIFEQIGGRLVHLNAALKFKDDIQKRNSDISEAHLTEQIIQEVVTFFKPNLLCIAKTELRLLRFLFVKSCPFMPEEFRTDDKEHNSAISKAADNLVKNNVLRYNAKGKLTWNSTVVEKLVIKKFFSD